MTKPIHILMTTKEMQAQIANLENTILVKQAWEKDPSLVVECSLIGQNEWGPAHMPPGWNPANAYRIAEPPKVPRVVWIACYKDGSFGFVHSNEQVAKERYQHQHSVPIIKFVEVIE